MKNTLALRARRILTLADATPATRRNELLAPLSFLDNAVLVYRNGLVLAVEPYATFRRRAGIALTDAGEISLIPGLINAHSHIEFSFLHDKTRLGQGFAAWARQLPRTRPQKAQHDAMHVAAEEMAAHGIVHVGDISAKPPVMQAGAFFGAGLDASFFIEAFGFQEYASPDLLRSTIFADIPAHLHSSCALSGHALFSTSPKTLRQARQDCRERGLCFSIHLAEHEDEMNCLLDGSGPLAELLRERGVWPSDYVPPGKRPIAHAHELGLLGDNTLAVHCVHCQPEEATLLAASKTAVCLCPRSNAAIGVGGQAPVQSLVDASVLLCLGTDSLASNFDLNLWNEARALRTFYPLPDSALLRMMTINAAHALRRFDLGRLAPGCRAAWAVLPDDFSQTL